MSNLRRIRSFACIGEAACFHAVAFTEGLEPTLIPRLNAEDKARGLIPRREGCAVATFERPTFHGLRQAKRGVYRQ